MTNSDSTIPYGYCHCGCGQKTNIASQSDRASGRIKGQPSRYLRNHDKRKAPPGYKHCHSCKTVKRTQEFAACHARHDGLQSRCRECDRAIYQRDSETAKARERKRYRDNPEAYKAQVKEWQARNKERVKGYKVKWKAKNKEALRVYAHVRRLRIGQSSEHHTVEEIWQMAESQDWLCAYCESPLFGTFEIDHMTPLSRGGSNAWDNIAIACVWCNRSKGPNTAEEFMDQVGFRSQSR